MSIVIEIFTCACGLLSLGRIRINIFLGFDAVANIQRREI